MAEIQKPDFVPNLINAEPAALLGLSLPQVVRIVGIRAAICIPTGIILSLAVYAHVFSAVCGLVIGGGIALFLTKKKARWVLDEGRGKDAFYCQHKDEIAWEKFQSKLVGYGVRRSKKENHSFLIEDRKWSQR